MDKEARIIFDKLVDEFQKKDLIKDSALKVLIKIQREQLHENFPTLKSCAVEAIVLMYEEMILSWREHIKAIPKEDLTIEFTKDLEELLINRMITMNLAIKNVAKRLTGTQLSNESTHHTNIQP